MASAAAVVIAAQGLAFSFSDKRSLRVLGARVPFIHGCPSGVSRVPGFSSSKEKDAHCSRLDFLCKASSQGVPSELLEDSKFVPLNADDPTYGPPVLLLSGFRIEETAMIQELLKELDGEFLKIIHCTEDMIDLSLWDAMHTQQSNLKAVKDPKSLPRICILSGLSGEEMMMFIDTFPETGLEPPAFAALVPNSAAKTVREVMEEIMGDHETLDQARKKVTSHQTNGLRIIFQAGLQKVKARRVQRQSKCCRTREKH
ncbi:hypothetical protein Syun_000760 [Stephania yunnanensis]|uniref:Uncharacterized protein n=1 Tax=Stephania yunnanensis TaxID=152371 RepID=A0AAP0LDK8_9MAGN